jgi:hypothetical protein
MERTIDQETYATNRAPAKPTTGFRRTFALAAAIAAAIVLLSSSAKADEGGAGYWLTGSAGSLAASPLTAGCSQVDIFYFTDVSAGGAVTVAKQVAPGGVKIDFNGTVNANVSAKVPAYLFGVSCVPTKKILGGQLNASLTAFVGHSSLDATATVVGTANGTNVDLTKGKSDSRTGFGDLYPNVNLRWHDGVNNYMVYFQPGWPVGVYDAARMANIGLGHMVLDQGGAYTYLNPKTRYEFSVQTGLTYNFENGDTNYKNGVDSHTDWGASRFLTRSVEVGAVGYYYQQLSGDTGSGARLGDFKSRVAAIGPQFAYIHKVSASWENFLALKAYWEFAAENRTEGWNIFVTYVFAHKAHARTAGIE